LIKLDFPALLLPKNAISAKPSEGNCSGEAALTMNSAIKLPKSEAGGKPLVRNQTLSAWYR